MLRPPGACHTTSRNSVSREKSHTLELDERALQHSSIKKKKGHCPSHSWTHSCVTKNKFFTLSRPQAGRFPRPDLSRKVRSSMTTRSELPSSATAHETFSTQQAKLQERTCMYICCLCPVLPPGCDRCPRKSCPQSARQCTPKPSDSPGWVSWVGPSGPCHRHQAHCLPFVSLADVSSINGVLSLNQGL